MSISTYYEEYYYGTCLCRLWLQTMRDRCQCPSEFVEIITLECEEIKRDIAKSTNLSN